MTPAAERRAPLDRPAWTWHRHCPCRGVDHAVTRAPATQTAGSPRPCPWALLAPRAAWEAAAATTGRGRAVAGRGLCAPCPACRPPRSQAAPREAQATPSSPHHPKGAPCPAAGGGSCPASYHARGCLVATADQRVVQGENRCHLGHPGKAHRRVGRAVAPFRRRHRPRRSGGCQVAAVPVARSVGQVQPTYTYTQPGTRTQASTQHQPMSVDVRALHAPTRCHRRRTPNPRSHAPAVDMWEVLVHRPAGHRHQHHGGPRTDGVSPPRFSRAWRSTHNQRNVRSPERPWWRATMETWKLRSPVHWSSRHFGQQGGLAGLGLQARH